MPTATASPPPVSPLGDGRGESPPQGGWGGQTHVPGAKRPTACLPIGDSSSPPKESWSAQTSRGRARTARPIGPRTAGPEGGGDRSRRDRCAGRDGCRSRPPRRFTEPGTMPGGAGHVADDGGTARGSGGSSRMRFPRSNQCRRLELRGGKHHVARRQQAPGQAMGASDHAGGI